MKTLITLAMLSAAGTVFAAFTQEDAAGWLAKNADGSYVSSESTTFTVGEDGSISVVLNDGASWTVSDGGRRSFTLAVTVDMDKLLALTSDTTLFTVNATNTPGFGITGEGTIRGYWNTGLYTSAPAWDLTATASAPYASGTQTILFSFTNDGSAFYNQDGGYYSGTGLKGDVGTATTLTISADAADALVNVVGWTDRLWINDTDRATLAASAIATSKTLVIPEPSAFGLLAGVGALALVAARRRRTK